MPATQGYRLSEWHEPPFLTGTHSLEASMDTRVFNLNDVDDVATCLLETDEQVDAYRWLLSGDAVRELALESAKVIIEKRKERYADNLADISFKKAKAQQELRSAGKRLSLVVSLAQDLTTGETTVTEHHIPTGRVFG